MLDMGLQLPTISVWQNLGTEWAVVGMPAISGEVMFEQRHLEPGTWQMTVPYDQTALTIRPDRLVTIDWRGQRTTWCIDSFVPSSDERGETTLAVGGPSALSMLGWELAWPNPALGLGAQPATGLTTGFAETVILSLIAGNFRDRRGAVITVPTSAGRGISLSARTRFNNLLELVTKKARRGGIGIDVGLVNNSGTSLRATLAVTVYVPVDRSLRVRLSQQVGTLRDWTQTQTAPTVTKAIVGGAGDGTTRVFSTATSTAGDAAATAWGGHRVEFINGPDSFDTTELVQAGQETLDAGAATTALSLTSAEAVGLQAFTHYNVGDTATAELLTGLEVVDVITAIRVEIGDTGVDVTPVFGKPETLDPQLTLAKMIAAQRARIRALETRR